MNSGIIKLLILSHVRHYEWQNKIYAYGPYAREIDIWADLFPQIIIAAPCRYESPPGDAVAFSRQNIRIVPQLEISGLTWGGKLKQIVMLPLLVYSLARAMRKADAIHIRCPGNLGLLGAILAPLFSSNLVAKYAGQWMGYPDEPWTFRLQRTILRSNWWRSPVTVYGEWPDQPPHVIPFFTSILTEEQIARAQVATRYLKTHIPPGILYIGRLSEAKNVDVLISVVSQLYQRGIDTTCQIVGDGPHRLTLEREVSSLGIQSCVRFAGALPFEEVLDYYENADILVLASETEGWPKALAEAMAFGLICIGSDRGLIPHMLNGDRGLLVPARDERALFEVLLHVLENTQEYFPLRAKAAAWAQQFTLESLKEALTDLLSREWGLEMPSLSLSAGSTDKERSY